MHIVQNNQAEEAIHTLINCLKNLFDPLISVLEIRENPPSMPSTVAGIDSQ